MFSRIAVSFLSVSVCMSSVEAVSIRVVALSGEQAADCPAGAIYESFSPPVINDRGEIAFSGSLKTGLGEVTYLTGLGLWSEGGGELHLVARSGDRAAGTPEGVNFASMSNFNLSNSGHLVFEAQLGERSRPQRIVAVDEQSGEVELAPLLAEDSDTGIWIEGDGETRMVVREGQAMQGETNGPVVESFGRQYFGFYNNYRSHLAIGDSGKVVFPVAIQVESPATRYGEVWTFQNGTLQPIWKSAVPHPSEGTGAYLTLPDVAPSINPDGEVAFLSSLRCDTCDDDHSYIAGVMKTNSEAVIPVALTGSPAPGAPGNAVFGTQYSSPTINSHGETAFRGVWYSEELGHADWALWSDAGGALHPVALLGHEVPVTSGIATIKRIEPPQLNDLGDVVFRGTLSTDNEGITTANDVGLWVESAGELRLLLQEGQQAPGMAEGTVIAALGGFELNSAGQILFNASLRSDNGEIDAHNDVAIWVGDLDGVLRLMLREGDHVETSPGIFQTISKFDIWPGGTVNWEDIGLTGGSDGRPRLFNDRGEFAFKAVFADGDTGLLVASLHPVPEPSTAVVGAFVLVPLLFRWLREKHWQDRMGACTHPVN